MNKRLRYVLIGLVPTIAVAFMVYLFVSNDLALLQPMGTIADQQKELLVFATLPVFALTIYISVKYREGNKKAHYKPEWDHSKKLEAVWWGIPIAIIFVLSVITWVTTHSLDPYKPIASKKEPLTIQVVALQWKWLFLYPEEQIASVNYVQFPEDRPVNFQLTADAPMNSFWIPKLGGQIYAMPGMATQLHLQANEPGEFPGVSANNSGEGFANMKFVAKATNEQEFQSWVGEMKAKPQQLDQEVYSSISEPSVFETPEMYRLTDTELFASVVHKYMRDANHSLMPVNTETSSSDKSNYSGGDH